MSTQHSPEQIEAAVKGVTTILAVVFLFGGVFAFGTMLLLSSHTGLVALYGAVYFGINAACWHFGYAYAAKLANGIRQQIDDMPV